MKYYVYALDVKNRPVSITVALSFQNENAAREAWRDASRVMNMANCKVFQFGHTSNSQVANDTEVAFDDAVPQLRIDLTTLPRNLSTLLFMDNLDISQSLVH